MHTGEKTHTNNNNNKKIINKKVKRSNLTFQKKKRFQMRRVGQVKLLFVFAGGETVKRLHSSFVASKLHAGRRECATSRRNAVWGSNGNSATGIPLSCAKRSFALSSSPVLLIRKTSVQTDTSQADAKEVNRSEHSPRHQHENVLGQREQLQSFISNIEQIHKCRAPLASSAPLWAALGTLMIEIGIDVCAEQQIGNISSSSSTKAYTASADSLSFFSQKNDSVVVCGEAVSAVECLTRALEYDPTLSHAWDTLGILLASVVAEGPAEAMEGTPQERASAASPATNNTSTRGAITIRIDGSDQSYSAVDCFAKAIETYRSPTGTNSFATTCTANPAVESLSSVSTAASAKQGSVASDPASRAPVQWWRNLALAMASSASSTSASLASSRGSTDTTTTTDSSALVFVKIKGKAYTVIDVFAMWAGLEPEGSQTFIPWYNLSTLIAHEDSEALKAFINAYNAHIMAEESAKGAPREELSKLPTPPSRRTVSINGRPYALKDLIVKSIEVLGEDDLVSATPCWVRLGNSLSDDSERHRIELDYAVENGERGESSSSHHRLSSTASVFGKNFTMLECFSKAAEGAELAVAQSLSASIMSNETRASFANVWHTLGAHMRAEDTVTVPITASVSMSPGDSSAAPEEIQPSHDSRTLTSLTRKFGRIEAFARAVELSPKDPRAWYTLALALPTPSPETVSIPTVRWSSRVEKNSTEKQQNEEEESEKTTNGIEEPFAIVHGVRFTRPQCIAKMIELALFSKGSSSSNYHSSSSSSTSPLAIPASAVTAAARLEASYSAFSMLGTHLLATDSIREEAVQTDLQKVVSAMVANMQSNFHLGDATNVDDAADPDAELESSSRGGVPPSQSSLPSMPEIPQLTRSTVVLKDVTLNATQCFVAALEARMAGKKFVLPSQSYLSPSLLSCSSSSATVSEQNSKVHQEGKSLRAFCDALGGHQSAVCWIHLGQILSADESEGEKASRADEDERDRVGGKGGSERGRDDNESDASSIFLRGLFLANERTPFPISALQCYAFAVACDPESPETWFRCGLALINVAKKMGKERSSAVPQVSTNLPSSLSSSPTQSVLCPPADCIAHAVCIGGKRYSVIDCFVQTVALAPDDPMGYTSLALSMDEARLEEVTIMGVPNPKKVISNKSPTSSSTSTSISPEAGQDDGTSRPDSNELFVWTKDDVGNTARALLQQQPSPPFSPSDVS